MTITVSAPSLAGRRNTLRWLARNWGQRGTVVSEFMLAATVHESMDEPLMAPHTCGICLTCTWEAYRWDLALADGIEHDPDAEERSPDDIGEGLTYEQAREEIWMRVADLEDVLLRGVGAGRQGAARRAA